MDREKAWSATCVRVRSTERRDRERGKEIIRDKGCTRKYEMERVCVRERVNK